MANIVGIRFKNTGKVYYFDPGDFNLEKGGLAVVETSRGEECGEVVLSNQEAPDSTIVKPLKPVLRPATQNDIARMKENAAKEEKALHICQEKILQHKLDMKLVDVEYAFDGSKILFYFTADGRVDFRSLVKDLASVFHTRIELRQIGVRDEAKMLGGLGICGRPFCCTQFLPDFQPVSIKMAKEQGLSLNPTKISGTCGRLMCCLKYEQDTYEALIKASPRVGALVNTDEGRGIVQELNLLAGTVRVRLDRSPDSPPVLMPVDKVKVIRDNKGGAARATTENISENSDDFSDEKDV
ncbi:MAG: stage 0 sporulation family protein [Clostridia bacterium]|nr:stage 0 sporulation family protein [Clostridia bacterium]